MADYLGVIKKESRPYLESLKDDLQKRRDPLFFWPTGTQVYVGRQGSGKTISAVRHLIKLKERYPRAVVVSNIRLNFMRGVRFQNERELDSIQKKLDPTKHYIYFQSMDELEKVLVHVNNGYMGVIYVVDEIHTYFNALDSKNVPMFVFTEISQQRKQRKLIIGTSQLFLRMAKPLREQCDNLIVCNTTFGVFTTQLAYDGMSLSQDYDGSLSGVVKKRGWFFQTRKIRNSFDTFQKVVSGAEQYEAIHNLTLTDKKGKKVKLA